MTAEALRFEKLDGRPVTIVAGGALQQLRVLSLFVLDDETDGEHQAAGADEDAAKKHGDGDHGAKASHNARRPAIAMV